MSYSNECKDVLLIEDDADLREQMASVLREEGYEVITSANGSLALGYLTHCTSEQLPGCIILDLMMPVMTGSEFLAVIERDYPKLSKI